MEPQALLGAALVGTAIPVAWGALAAERATNKAVAANLRRGLAAGENLRTARLSRPTGDRAVKPLVQALADRARRLSPSSLQAGLEQRLIIAGLQGRWPIERVLAAKLAAAAFAGFLGVINLAASPSPRALVVVVLTVLAVWYLPDVLVRSRAKQRQGQVLRELPDTLDQLTITVEAGLGFEAALARTARASNGPLASELARTVQDIQLGASRSDALRALGKRLEVPELRRVIGALRHAEKYGVPVAQVLRIESTEMRERSRQRAEELAMKLPVKILFPLMLCILPALFVIVLGPAIVQFMG